jgi:hypothetical protein
MSAIIADQGDSGQHCGILYALGFGNSETNVCGRDIDHPVLGSRQSHFQYRSSHRVFSNGNGQKIVSILEDGVLNTTDPLIGTIVEIQGFYSGNPVLPFDPSGTLIDVTTEIIASGSVIYSDLNPVSHFVGNEWFGVRTSVSLNNTINSPVLDLYAANVGWTYMVDSQGLVRPDSTSAPEPSTLWLFTTFAVASLYAGMSGWRRRS